MQWHFTQLHFAFPSQQLYILWSSQFHRLTHFSLPLILRNTFILYGDAQYWENIGPLVTIPSTYLCHKSVDPTLRNCGSFVSGPSFFYVCEGSSSKQRAHVSSQSLVLLLPPSTELLLCGNCAAPQSCIPNLFSIYFCCLYGKWRHPTLGSLSVPLG